VFRLLMVLFFALGGVGGYLAFDFHMAKQKAAQSDVGVLTFPEYLNGLAQKFSNSASASDGVRKGLPTELADMLPTAPEGWAVRPTAPEDAAGFMAKKASDTPQDAAKYVENVTKPRSGKGLDQAAMTYEKGDRRVVFQIVRFPDSIFTSFAEMQQRMELQSVGPQFQSTDFMTVRGLDVTEDLLPKGMRARYFMADIGAQIQIRVVASKRMSDEDLLPFFETLHVKAMNASVVEKKEGLGDVPVIVLASALGKDMRAAYEADKKARDAAEAAERQAAREEEAARQAEADVVEEETAEPEATSLRKVFEGQGRLQLDSEKN
jgi:hypothetical protein